MAGPLQVNIVANCKSQTQVPTWISWLELSKVKAVWSISRASLAFSIQITKDDIYEDKIGVGWMCFRFCKRYL